jgi:hypothetical protein
VAGFWGGRVPGGVALLPKQRSAVRSIKSLVLKPQTRNRSGDLLITIQQLSY